MQGVRRDLVELQAQQLGLPMWPVELPWPCPNEEYERRMQAVVDRAHAAGITRIVFGDLFLENVRAYRVDKLAGSGIEPMFPIWCGASATRALAGEMISSGVEAVITAVDDGQLDGSFSGRVFGPDLLRDLPSDVDPLGENGEFHTFCYASPLFE